MLNTAEPLYAQQCCTSFLHPPRSNDLCQLHVLAGDNLEIHPETDHHTETGGPALRLTDPSLGCLLRSSDRSRDPGFLGHLNKGVGEERRGVPPHGLRMIPS